MSQHLRHDARPNDLIADVLDATTRFTLASGQFVLGSLGEIQAAAENLHLAARALYLATQARPDALVDLAAPVEPAADVAELTAMLTQPSEPYKAHLEVRDIGEDRRGIFADLAYELRGAAVVVTPGPGGAVVDLTATLGRALERLDPYLEDPAGGFAR